MEVGMLLEKSERSGRLFKRKRFYKEILRNKGYRGYLTHVKRQMFQE